MRKRHRRRAAPAAQQHGQQQDGEGLAGDGNASPSRAPLSASVPAAPPSDEGPAPQLLPPMDLPAHAPVPDAAPSESVRAASRVPESFRDDPFAELSPGPLSAAPLLHPQCQRELIEQAAGMSTRQVAGLLAAAAPEVVPPRDTLRAVAPDRYALKVSIDQECEQGLRLLKGLLSHLDPRMSWGDLVARLVREAVVRHDPRGGGNGHRRRRSAGSAGASSSRAPKTRRAAGTAAGPAQGVSESSGRAPNRTRAAVAPAAPARRGGGDTPAPQGDTPATERQNPIAMLGALADRARPHRPRPPLPGRSRRSLHCRTAPAQVAFHRAPQLLLRRSSRAAARRMAPMPALACRSRWSPLQSRHSGHRSGCGCRLTRASQHAAAVSVGQSRRSGNRARRMRQMRRILPLHPEK